MDLSGVIDQCIVRADGCMGWDGAHDGKGYPHFTRKVGDRMRTFRVFRALYESLRGAIPEGCVLHHECENKWCVNPFHCVPVSKRDHDSVIHPRPFKACCKYGHEMAGDNVVYWAGGRRKCRTCLRRVRSAPEYKAQMRARYYQRKAEREALA